MRALFVVLACAAALWVPPSARRTGYAGYTARFAAEDRKIFVGGVAWRADAAAVAEAFERFGAVDAVDLPRDAADPSGRAHRGYGFVTFVSREAARDALAASPAVRLLGRDVKCAPARRSSAHRCGGARRRQRGASPRIEARARARAPSEPAPS